MSTLLDCTRYGHALNWPFALASPSPRWTAMRSCKRGKKWTCTKVSYSVTSTEGALRLWQLSIVICMRSILWNVFKPFHLGCWYLKISILCSRYATWLPVTFPLLTKIAVVALKCGILTGVVTLNTYWKIPQTQFIFASYGFVQIEFFSLFHSCCEAALCIRWFFFHLILLADYISVL